MKASFWFLVLFCAVSPLYAETSSNLWIEDFEAAKKLSAQTGKDILVDVTGSDWCPPCMKMEEEVFTRPEFAKQAQTQFVLLRLDFPKELKQSEKIKQQNQRLSQQYPFEGFPTYFLMEKNGKPYGAYTGYLPGGTKAFFKLLQSMADQKTSLVQLLKAADQAPAGVDRAQKLHQLYAKAESWGLAPYYTDLPAKIIAEDRDNKAGLKERYQLLAEYTYLLNTWTDKSDFKKAASDVSKLVQKAEKMPDVQQKILFTLGMIYLNALSDQVKAKETFLKVKALDKSSQPGLQAAQMLDSLP